MKISDFFKDVDDAASMKRVIAAIFAFALIVALIVNLSTSGRVKPDADLISTFEFVIIALVLGISSEKFTKRGITSVSMNDTIKKEEKKAEIEQEAECADCKKEK